MLGLSLPSFTVPVPKAERLSGFWGTLKFPRRGSTSEVADLAMLEAGQFEEARVRPEMQRRQKSDA
ncbi:hypothetical protein AK830_g6511 [Neonectria ditissima]|uniref:Uncharacterized protein n=1 Tax=Neonectria ditissima TaxID=78410 RepID=A0A0P7BIV0_9HYPO|nr:hypothetical protein AK830_g6511 [Neonectria ditissima]